MQPRVRSFLKRRPGLVLALLSAVVFAAAGTGACSATRLAPAVPPGSQVDIFTQVPRAQSDILWIVDDSESMSREQDQLADSFPKFFAHLQDSGVDYRIAVTTADVIDNLGNLVGDPSVIVGNSLVYFDSSHLTLEYSRLLAPVIAALADRTLAHG